MEDIWTQFREGAEIERNIVAISAIWIAVGKCERLAKELSPKEVVKAIQKLANDLRHSCPETLAEINKFFAEWKP